MTHTVVFHPLARDDLFNLYDCIAERANDAAASSYIDRIEELCLSPSRFPARGIDRSDIGPGVRTLALERRTLVAYRVDAGQVEILRVLYAGREFGVDALRQ